VRGEVGFGPLHDRLARIAGQVRRVPKTHRHPHFGYMYAGVEDITESVGQAMAEEKVILVPHLLSWRRYPAEPQRKTPTMTTTIEMRYVFSCVDEDGKEYELPVMWAGEADDQQDKGLAKALTMARKTFLRDFFRITIGDETDTDREHPKGSEVDDKKPAPSTISDAQRRRLFGLTKTALGKDAESETISWTLRAIVRMATKGVYNLHTLPGSKSSMDAIEGWLGTLRDDPASVRDALRGYFAEHPEHKPARTEQKPAEPAPAAPQAPEDYEPPAGKSTRERNERIAYRVIVVNDDPKRVAETEEVSAAVVTRAVKEYREMSDPPWNRQTVMTAPQPIVIDGEKLAEERAELARRFPGGQWPEPLVHQFRTTMAALEEMEPEPADGNGEVTTWAALADVLAIDLTHGKAERVEQLDVDGAMKLLARFATARQQLADELGE
jgi:hypothetical protein